ncbi:hypothetical protein ANTQUA_LOCUS8999 [Anthophora quadrimaculata]
MKQYNFLAPSIKTTYYRDRDRAYAKYYTTTHEICFCKDIPGLFDELGQPYSAKEWRLFVDSSKESLKAVLLHNGNEKPSIPIAHAVNPKESYETMVKLLKCINYEENEWRVCADLKVVGMLCGMQGGYTKYCCLLCFWDCRAREHHYKRKQWPERKNVTVGQDNIKYVPLIKKENVILPPLHIKLGLFKNFVTALNKENQAFAYLRTIFKSLSFAKIKEGVFDGQQIKKLLEDEEFGTYLSSAETVLYLAPKMSDPKAGTSGMQEATSDNESDDFMFARNRKKNRKFVIMDSDSDLENVENTNVNIELLGDTQDEVFEEDDWDDCTDIESEIEQHQSELTEDTETWEDDGSPTKIPFVGKPGLQKLRIG